MGRFLGVFLWRGIEQEGEGKTDKWREVGER